MKKILSLLAILPFYFMTLFAQDTQINDTVQFVTASEVSTGVLGFVWEGGEESSAAYAVTLAHFDVTTYSAKYFAGVAAYASAFAINGYPGYFQCSSDIVLQYGDNYTTIGAQGASATIVASWEAAWNACVNESDFTLKSGYYVIFVEGLDSTFNTTEVESYTIVSVAETVETEDPVEPTDPEDTTTSFVNVHSTSNSCKFIGNDGRMYILKGDNVYDVRGNRLTYSHH